MIFITGDTHGQEERFRRFRKALFRRRRNYCVVCGDFGFVWDGSKKEQAVLKRLSKLDCMLLFVEGTHDNLDRLAQFPEEDWKGGRVRRVCDNVLWLHRGDIFDLDGATLFAMGGGHSIDADERVPGQTWWPGETPTPEELVLARETLAHHGNKVDLIISHQPPSVELGLIRDKSGRGSAFDAFLADVDRAASYRHWYFGGAHVDRAISARMTAVFERMHSFDNAPPKKRKWGKRKQEVPAV